MATLFDFGDDYEDEDDIFQDNCLTSRELLTIVLSCVSLDCLYICARVCKDWRLIAQYLVPTPLSHLRMVACGELLYHLPAIQEVPKTVILKVSFTAGQPKWVEILSSKTTNKHNVQKKLNQVLKDYRDLPKNGKITNNHLKNGFNNNDNNNNNRNSNNDNNNNENENDNIETRIQNRENMNQEIIHISDIKFIIDGHWTPTFEKLKNSDEFNLDESQFFSRNKSFSIVTKSFNTYDFIAFNSETSKNIISILRNILRQSSSSAKKMAIFAKANNKYLFAMQQQNKPLMFTTNAQALQYDLFVMTLQDSFHSIESEISFPMPIDCINEITASNLYPTILSDNIMITKWKEHCRSKILEFLQKRGLIDIYHSKNGDVAYDVTELFPNENNIEEEEESSPGFKVSLDTSDSVINEKSPSPYDATSMTKKSKFTPFTPANRQVGHFKTFLQTVSPNPTNFYANNSNASVGDDLNNSNNNSNHNRRASGHQRKTSKSAILVENMERGNINVHDAFQQIKHEKRSSSLFNLKSFPIDESYDLFKGSMLDDDDDDIDGININKPNLLDRDSLNNLTNVIGFKQFQANINDDNNIIDENDESVTNHTNEDQCSIM